MYYFAYASNMSSPRLLSRVPSAHCLGVAYLVGYELKFHKPGHDNSAKCSIVRKTGASTLGVVYEIPADQRYTLDRIEGLGYGYEARELNVELQSGRNLSAVAYIGTESDKTMKPYIWYRQHLVEGAREHGIAQQYIDKILCVEAVPDPNSARHSHEMSIYPADPTLALMELN